MDLEEFIVRVFAEMVVARDVSSIQHVGVFYVSFLPRAVRVCEIDGSVQLPGNHFMFCELGSVVSGDGLYAPHLLKGSSMSMTASATPFAFLPSGRFLIIE